MVLYKSVLPRKYWPDAVQCFCQTHKTVYEFEGSKTPRMLRRQKGRSEVNSVRASSLGLRWGLADRGL